jgi:uncharacterized protein (TIGR02145 family)
MKNRIIPYLLFGIVILVFSCEKGQDVIKIVNPWIRYGSMSDLDGNAYKTIKIGTQTWMVQNLKTTKYNDGTPIPVVTDALDWYELSTPGCCWQNNDPVRKVTYGVLYNWYAVNTGKLCPAGWHIPTDAEWTRLTDYLGGDNLAGGKLKEAGFKHWFSPNTGATNETAFAAYPGGERHGESDALFENIQETGCWWTYSSDGDLAINRIMYDNSIRVQRFFYPKKSGLSVRCVWDY